MPANQSVSGIAPLVPSGPADVANHPANSWWAVKTSNGAIGLQKGAAPPSNSVGAEWVGAADTLSELVTKHSTSVAADIRFIGGDAKQVASLITQLDAGSILNGSKSYVYVGSKADKYSVSSDVSTKVGSEAVGTSLIPGTSGIVNSLSNISLSSLFGSMSFWKGIGLVLAGAAVLIFAALQLKGGGI